MAMHNLGQITAALIAAGMAPKTSAAIIASAATPKERLLIGTLETLAAEARAQKFEPPAIVAIGDIVKFRQRLVASPAIPQPK